MSGAGAVASGGGHDSLLMIVGDNFLKYSAWQTNF